MEAMGVQKLYEPSPTPIFSVGLAADVLGRVPLMPLFLLGKYTPTAKRAVATRARRRRKAPKEAAAAGGLELDIHRISLVQIFVI